MAQWPMTIAEPITTAANITFVLNSKMIRKCVVAEEKFIITILANNSFLLIVSKEFQVTVKLS